MADDGGERRRQLARARAQKKREADKEKREAGDPEAIAKHAATLQRAKDRKRKDRATDAPAAVTDRATKRRRQAQERAEDARQADAHRAANQACKASSRPRKLLAQKTALEPYRVKLAAACPRCKAPRLDCEVKSALGNTLQCPACSGQV